MIRYKMLARDVDSIPTQYRTWVVPNQPDFTGQYYTGLKSGKNPLVDISAYQITDDSVIADFNLPSGDDWTPLPVEQYKAFPVRKVLPREMEDSSLAIIDGYAYMFGGKVTASIFRADINKPADWIDTGATLPTTLYGASLAVIGDTIYLFGGNTGNTGITGATDHIYTASVGDPLTWTDRGSHLPHKLQYSSLGMANGQLFLFGGLQDNAATSKILSSTTASPLTWVDTGDNLPISVYGSSLGQINNAWYLFGGQTASNQITAGIWSASLSTPTMWSFDGYLPYRNSFSQFFTIGTDGYLIGPMSGAPTNNFTGIIRCQLSNPVSWQASIYRPYPINTNRIVPGVISHSQLAVIYDRVFLFGGSGLLAVFCCNQQLKYDPHAPVVVSYGNITRTVFRNTDNADNPYQALCFPYWKTDYQ